jgi:hypothetical protein
MLVKVVTEDGLQTYKIYGEDYPLLHIAEDMKGVVFVKDSKTRIRTASSIRLTLQTLLDKIRVRKGDVRYRDLCLSLLLTSGARIYIRRNNACLEVVFVGKSENIWTYLYPEKMAVFYNDKPTLFEVMPAEECSTMRVMSDYPLFVVNTDDNWGSVFSRMVMLFLVAIEQGDRDAIGAITSS